eukprot:2604425-Lingulodinium_polyedra.AAC.1
MMRNPRPIHRQPVDNMGCSWAGHGMCAGCPWIALGLPMDSPWIVRGQSVDSSWAVQVHG